MPLNDTLDQMDLTDICRTFHPKPAKYTLFSNAHRTFCRKDHMLGYKKISTILKRLKSYPASILTTKYETSNQPQKKKKKLEHKYTDVK